MTDFLQSIAAIPPMSADDYRKATLHTDIYPMLARWGFEERFRHELTAWPEKRQQRAFERVMALLLGKGAIVALAGIRGAGTCLGCCRATIWSCRPKAGAPVTQENWCSAGARPLIA